MTSRGGCERQGALDAPKCFSTGSDLEFAAEKAATLKAGEGGYFSLPPGGRSVVYKPDGTTVPATRIWVRNNGTGTFHGAPWE